MSFLCQTLKSIPERWLVVRRIRIARSCLPVVARGVAVVQGLEDYERNCRGIAVVKAVAQGLWMPARQHRIVGGRQENVGIKVNGIAHRTVCS